VESYFYFWSADWKIVLYQLLNGVECTLNSFLLYLEHFSMYVLMISITKQKSILNYILVVIMTKV
jgi:hypothetical protein